MGFTRAMMGEEFFFDWRGRVGVIWTPDGTVVGGCFGVCWCCAVGNGVGVVLGEICSYCLEGLETF